jgi:hypothetical protein
MRVLRLALLLACLIPGAARAEAPRSFVARSQLVLADLLVARPLALLELATGTALLPLLYPHSYLSGIEIDLIEVCVLDPWGDVFSRPLGDFGWRRGRLLPDEQQAAAERTTAGRSHGHARVAGHLAFAPVAP